MTREKRLKKEAMESAHWRGHKFNREWETNPEKSRFNRECVRCGAWVVVTMKPAPNDIDIGGSAVAINCKKD